MNKQELAALIAQTHPQPASTHSSAQTSRVTRSNRHMRSPNSPLSPRQIFQSHVRTLSDDGQSRTSPQKSPNQKNRELQHLSSLRVHVKPHGQVKNRLQTDQARNATFDFLSEEPDFVAEERAAWNRRTPERESRHKVGRASQNAQEEVLSLRESSHDLPKSPTKVFAPLTTSTDSNERPKTRRGLSDASDSAPVEAPQQATNNHRDKRRSKFSEGTMTDRSSGIASTWEENGMRISESSERTNQDTDSDATPRAARLSKDTDSTIDISEFQPRGSTPGTLKNRLTRLAQTFKPHEESSQPSAQQTKPKRKGLRKSLSLFFGASTHDLVDSDTPVKKPDDAHKELLNERKRKAEEAYAQQFGSKKRKSNDRLSIEPGIAPTDQPRTIKKRSGSIGHSNRTPQHATRQQTDPIIKKSRPQDSGNTGEKRHVVQKRASRKELQKENERLRALLHEQQVQQQASIQRSASKSTVHLPMTTSDRLVSKPAFSSSTHTRSSSIGSNGNKRQTQHQPGVPPVPALPSRAALVTLNNTNSHSKTTRSFDNGRKTAGKPNGRVVSTIFEETDPDSDGKENAVQHGHSKQQGLGRIDEAQDGEQFGTVTQHGEKWKWPDDVF